MGMAMSLNRPKLLFSVIVPCRDHLKELSGCLAALGHQDIAEKYEIIVVDSGTSDEMLRLIKPLSFVRLVRSSGPLNVAQAKNLGAAEARGDLLAFTDADCRPMSGWLTAAGEAMAGGARLVGGPVLDTNPLQLVSVADNLLQFVDQAPGRPASAAWYLPGCNLALERTLFRELSGFKEHLMRGSDSDFTMSVASRWPTAVRFCPKMKVRHQGRTTLRLLCRHHYDFGYYRCFFGLKLSPRRQCQGRQLRVTLAWSAKRLIYIIGRTLQWYPAAIWKILLLGPLLVLGLLAWACGCQRGCIAAAQSVSDIRATN